jgi:hypothetical protein
MRRGERRGKATHWKKPEAGAARVEVYEGLAGDGGAEHGDLAAGRVGDEAIEGSVRVLDATLLQREPGERPVIAPVGARYGQGAGTIQVTGRGYQRLLLAPAECAGKNRDD